MAKDVSFSGPLFDGRGGVDLREGISAVRKALADEAERMAAAALATSIRHHGTGRAERAVTSTGVSRVYQTGKYSLPVVAGPDETVVTTSLATYGPWLEGTGSRNATTHFKGYHAFRRAGQELEVRAGAIATVAMERWVGEMD